MDLNIEPKVNQSGCEILFVEAKKVLGNIISIYFFHACKRAEFSKSCNLIGSESGRYFTILPANPGGIVGSSFKSLFVNQQKPSFSNHFFLKLALLLALARER